MLMEPLDSGNLLSFFKAMADSSRLKIVGLLANGERNVRELAVLLELREPTVSHHLAILREQGLVRLRADGNVHWYRLNHDALKTLKRAVFSDQGLAKLADQAERQKGDRPRTYDQKVLGNFLDGERLIEIPVSRKKRMAILRWLAARFGSDATYSEADVNRIIKRHHSDCATLRRELIGCRMLHRERGLYRRLPETEWRSE
jgi:DNA-binding transcriptional ArsR family regulator